MQRFPQRGPKRVDKYAHEAIEQNEISGDGDIVEFECGILFSKGDKENYPCADHKGEDQSALAYQQACHQDGECKKGQGFSAAAEISCKDGKSH